jgi:hypothetical protein
LVLWRKNREGVRYIKAVLYKKVVRYKLVTRGRGVIGVDPKSRQVEYLPADEESRKCFDQVARCLCNGFVDYLKKSEGGFQAK